MRLPVIGFLIDKRLRVFNFEAGNQAHGIVPVSSLFYGPVE